MIIYNVTTKVDPAIKNDWINWIKAEHIPDIIATGCFTNATIAQLLEVDDSEGPTYTIQYHAESKAQYNFYTEKFDAVMRQKAFDKWGNKFIAFRSLMQVVN
jgi:hydroxyethylthiazole kinase-like sugar kinase family protein